MTAKRELSVFEKDFEFISCRCASASCRTICYWEEVFLAGHRAREFCYTLARAINQGIRSTSGCLFVSASQPLSLRWWKENVWRLEFSKSGLLIKHCFVSIYSF